MRLELNRYVWLNQPDVRAHDSVTVFCEKQGDIVYFDIWVLRVQFNIILDFSPARLNILVSTVKHELIFGHRHGSGSFVEGTWLYNLIRCLISEIEQSVSFYALRMVRWTRKWRGSDGGEIGAKWIDPGPSWLRQKRGLWSEVIKGL